MISISALLFALLVPSVAAAPGDLDRSFGEQGTVITAKAKRVAVNDVVAVNGGVIEVGGTASSYNARFSWTVRRWTLDGRLDETFGEGGTAPTPVGKDLADSTAEWVDPDGRLVVVGAIADPNDVRWSVVRYTAAGQLDRSFSDDGLTLIRVATPTTTRAVATGVVADGRGGYYVGGLRTKCCVQWGTVETEWVVAHVNGSGERDPSFGTNGLLRIPTEVSLATDSRGRLLTARYGYSRGGGRVVVARFGRDGQADGGFGKAGVARVSFGSFGSSTSLTGFAVQGVKPIIAALVGRDETHTTIGRLSADGLTDPSFGRGGHITLPEPRGKDTLISDLDLDARGRIVAAGLTGSSAKNARVMAVRLARRGRLDRAFGNRGVTVFRVRAADPPSGPSVSVASPNSIFIGGNRNRRRDGAGFITRLLG